MSEEALLGDSTWFRERTYFSGDIAYLGKKVKKLDFEQGLLLKIRDELC